jgi:hypothetical protein
MTDLESKARGRIDQILESAVVLSWKDLLRSSPTAVVQVEYATAPQPSLQYLKMWLSTTRGRWDLVCEYWMSAGTTSIPAIGLTFSNGHYSAHLARMLEVVMPHRNGIPNSLAGNTAVKLIVVHPPTENDRQQADDCMSAAYERLGLKFVKSQGAA